VICSLKATDLDSLCARLDPRARIAIVSCNSCARTSDGLGGRSGMDSLARALEQRGFTVSARILCGEACVKEKMAEAVADPQTREALEGSTVILPLACANSTASISSVSDLPRETIVMSIGAGEWSEDTGAVLKWPHTGIDLTVDEKTGMLLSEAARILGRKHGPYRD